MSDTTRATGETAMLTREEYEGALRDVIREAEHSTAAYYSGDITTNDTSDRDALLAHDAAQREEVASLRDDVERLVDRLETAEFDRCDAVAAFDQAFDAIGEDSKTFPYSLAEYIKKQRAEIAALRAALDAATAALRNMAEITPDSWEIHRIASGALASIEKKEKGR